MSGDLIPMSETATFDLICRQADVLAESTIIPAAYRRKSADIVAAGLAGRAFGWDVITALRQFHVIEGTASMRPESMLGLIRQAGHSVTIDVGDDEVTACGKRADTGDEHRATFTMDNAREAGLADKRNWKAYREAMLTWRAVSKLGRNLFSDVLLGVAYVPEELGADVGSDGDIIDAEVVDADPDAMPRSEAKRAVLDAVGGDRDRAIEVWDAEVASVFGDGDPTRTAVATLLEGLVSDGQPVDVPADAE